MVQSAKILVGRYLSCCRHVEHELCCSEPFPRWVCLLVMLTSAAAYHGCRVQPGQASCHVCVLLSVAMHLACMHDTPCSREACLGPLLQHAAGQHGQKGHATVLQGQAYGTICGGAGPCAPCQRQADIRKFKHSQTAMCLSSWQLDQSRVQARTMAIS